MGRENQIDILRVTAKLAADNQRDIEKVALALVDTQKAHNLLEKEHNELKTEVNKLTDRIQFLERLVMQKAKTP